MTQRQPWLSNAILESIFILSPAIIPVAVILLFNDYFIAAEVNTIWWVALVLCIDVSHVYSTLFRLYWDKQTFHAYKNLLVIIPATAFVVALSLHLYNDMLFWRILAYVAVYHFVRQQYGFMRLYSRNEQRNRWPKMIDTLAVYSATIYPLLYWHIKGTNKIAWFIKGDFIQIDLDAYQLLFLIMYVFILVTYVIKEIVLIVHNRSINIPKNMIIIGTYLSWYVGIVAFQGDLIFTLLNVVSHGIPYMALIWIYGEKKSGKEISFGVKSALTFIGILLVLAYFEETLWDNFVWKDHSGIFPVLVGAPIESQFILSALVALLVLPQVTHYVLDGFIWRFNKDIKARL